MKLAAILQQKLNVGHAAFWFSVDWDFAVVRVPSLMFLVKVKRVLNLDHQFWKCAYWADRHAGPLLLQYIEEHPSMADNYAQSFMLMRTWRRKESTKGSDWGSEAFVHDILRMLFVCDIYTP